MKAKEADALIATIRSFLDPVDTHKTGRQVPLDAAEATLARTTREATGSMGGHLKPFDDAAVERQYQAFKARFIDEAQIDPVLLRLIMVQPEITVDVERRMVSVDGATLRGRCARLIAGGWFDEMRSTAQSRRELARIGSDPSGNGNLGAALSQLRVEGFLTTAGEGWLKAPGMKVSETKIET